MALRISRKLWRRGRPSFCGVGKSPSMHSHSASERSLKYGLLMHARVAASTPDYPFSDSFLSRWVNKGKGKGQGPYRKTKDPGSASLLALRATSRNARGTSSVLPYDADRRKL